MVESVAAIDSTDHFYRRLLYPEHLYDDGSVRPNAYYLSGRPDPQVSVDLARLTTPEETAGRGRRPGAGVGELLAEIPLSLGLTVRHAPVPDNLAHSVIEGLADTRLHRQLCKELAEATRVIIQPAARTPSP